MLSSTSSSLNIEELAGKADIRLMARSGCKPGQGPHAGAIVPEAHTLHQTAA